MIRLVPDYAQPCPDCDGTGEHRMDDGKAHPCPRCDGSGQIGKSRR